MKVKQCVIFEFTIHILRRVVILFLIYINDIDLCSLGGSSIVMYADDVKLSRVMEKADPHVAYYQMREELENLLNWSNTWKMKISEPKCQHLAIGDQWEFPLKINGSVIPKTSTIRDLGIMVSSDLSFSSHIEKIVRSATVTATRILKSIVQPNLSVYLKSYTSYVRPILEYASTVWSPYSKNEILLVERVQNRFTKIALNKINYEMYHNFTKEERLTVFSLKSLQHRRIVYDLIECFKIVRGFGLHKHPVLDSMFILGGRQRRDGNSLYIRQEMVSTLQTQSFFKHRVTRIWNLLDEATVRSSTIESFKSKIDALDLVELSDQADCNIGA